MKLKDLNDEQIAKVVRVIRRVWGEIAMDIDTLEGPAVKNKEAIELCLDADRPAMIAGDEGKEVDALISSVEDDFSKILTFFAKRVKLV